MQYYLKYLGVQLDQFFNFSEHALELTKKCAGRIAFLYRNSSCLNEECPRILCNALIQPHLDYCCSSWYESLSKQFKDKLDVTKRRMVKLVYSKSQMANFHWKTWKIDKISEKMQNAHQIPSNIEKKMQTWIGAKGEGALRVGHAGMNRNMYISFYRNDN